VIPPVAGWRREELGDVLLLTPPEGDAVRYSERLAPIAPLAALVARHGGSRPVLDQSTFFTVEGELAAKVTLAEQDGRSLHLGFVWADSHYSLVSATSRGAAEHARYHTLVTRLVQDDTHHLGARPRRALHAALDGWEAVERGLRVDWVTPAFPRNPAAVTVYPALPRVTHDARPLSLLLRSHGVVHPSGRVSTRHGLRGACWRTRVATRDGGLLPREVVVAARGAYVYALRADGDAGDALDFLLDSLLPFPSPGDQVEAAMYDHWIN